MLNRPSGLTDADVATAVHLAWSVEPGDLSYAAVGFGSHHWITDDFFVTVDDAGERERLQCALRTGYALRHDADLAFVVAPIPANDGGLVAPVGERWVVHLYERLEVLDDTGYGAHDDPAVVDLVRAIHAATPLASAHARREDFSIWGRDGLEAAMSDVDEPWETGPFGERARRLLLDTIDPLQRLLAVHDSVAAEVPPDGWVITHGEPHRGNIFRTSRGWAVVDWDTALVAPAARDLWTLPATGGDPTLHDLYRLRWDLGEIAVYISGFHGAHDGDANDALSWQGLVRYLAPEERWPHLL